MNSFVLLNRKILQWEWYDDANVFRVFIHLIIKANYKDNKWRGHFIKRGQLITSIGNLSEEIGLSYKATRVALDKLKSTGEIEVKGANKFSLITIVEYDTYQGYEIYEGDQEANEGQSEGEQEANKGQQLNNNNNNNNDNNDNKTIVNRAAEENLEIMLSKEQYIGTMEKKFNLSKSKLRELYEQFNEHLILTNDGFKTENDYATHFMNWYCKTNGINKKTGRPKSIHRKIL